jgi:cytochrome c551/c552
MNLLHLASRKSILTGFIFLISFNIVSAQDGAALFKANCGSCHALDKVLSGPALRGVTSRGPWGEDINEMHKWVRNPAAYIPTTQYTRDLQKQYGQVMPSFTEAQLSDKDLEAIIGYLQNPPPPAGTGGNDKTPGGAPADSGRGAVIFGVISLILALVFLILMQVNSSLKKLSDDKEHIHRPEAVPFWKNKIYIALFAVVFFIVGGYFIAKGAIGLGRQKGYQPDQPIFFSHKVHAGINQVNCLYCHGSAWDSKHAAIPSLNVCMNCHKVVNEYTKGPKLYDTDGTEINGTAEIAKLYKYAGFTPGPGAVWDDKKGTSPVWAKIHNLPDHVYFNHSQHTKVGNVACQTCHGNIQQMDKVEQTSELSMGWCVNCHRESKVNFDYTDSTGNKFYSIYEKFHNDLRSDTIFADAQRTKIKEIRRGRMDSVTVENIGGTECQKCHY